MSNIDNLFNLVLIIHPMECWLLETLQNVHILEIKNIMGLCCLNPNESTSESTTSWTMYFCQSIYVSAIILLALCVSSSTDKQNEVRRSLLVITWVKEKEDENRYVVLMNDRDVDVSRMSDDK